MDRKGNLIFSFTDSLGDPITDEATMQRLIRKTKALPYYKEKLAEVTRMTYEEVNADTEAFTELYKKTPALKTESDVNMALARVSQKHYTPLVFEEEAPDRAEIQRQLTVEAEKTIRHFFWWKNKPERAQYVEENIPLVYDQKLNEWERRRDDFNAEQAREKKFKDAEYLHEYLEEKKPLEAYLSRDVDVIMDALKVESKSVNEDLPGDSGMDFYFDFQFGALYVSLDLPEVEEIPNDKAVYLPSGNVSFKQKTMKEIQLDYVKCVCGLAFYVAGRLFNVNSAINFIQINGFSQRINKASGVANDDYVYSVFFDRESFSQLRMQYIDPLEAMREFPSRIKSSVTGVLSTIRPFVVPGENDKNRGVFPQKEGKTRPIIWPATVDASKEEIEDAGVPVVENVGRIAALYTPGMTDAQPKESLSIEDLSQSTYLNNLGIQQEKNGKSDEAI